MSSRKGNQKGVFFNFLFLSSCSKNMFPNSVHKASSGRFRRSPELPADLLQQKNLCERPAATQRGATDGRVTVPSSDGSPRWSSIRELEAELWKLFLAHFTFAH